MDGQIAVTLPPPYRANATMKVVGDRFPRLKDFLVTLPPLWDFFLLSEIGHLVFSVVLRANRTLVIGIY
jgi:hypothetical protein